MPGDGAEELRRHREIEQIIASQCLAPVELGEPCLQALVEPLVLEFTRHVVNA
jgi:hypothetical protein